MPIGPWLGFSLGAVGVVVMHAHRARVRLQLGLSLDVLEDGSRVGDRTGVRVRVRVRIRVRIRIRIRVKVMVKVKVKVRVRVTITVRVRAKVACMQMASNLHTCASLNAAASAKMLGARLFQGQGQDQGCD